MAELNRNRRRSFRAIWYSAAMSKMTLDRMLQSQGFGSRKWCRQLIADGDVTIGAAVIDDWRSAVDVEDLEFTVFGETWRYREHVYLALNKPTGIECSRKPSHHPGVLTLFPEQFSWRDVQPVGRLDHDTTGLLLLSDDGAFIHAQSSPRRHVPKVYLATTAEPVTPALLAQLRAGVQLHDEPAPIAALHCEQRDSHAIEVVLEQGKYHQVKRMLAAAGNHCAALTRTAIGGLRLEDLELAPGEWCYLQAEQLGRLNEEAMR
jgi:16S rRNA pseudouridine516 synthase